MVFDGKPKVIDGHKFWKPEKYKGYLIQPYEGPDGRRTFLVGDGKRWLSESQKLEECAAYIDILVLAENFKKE